MVPLESTIAKEKDLYMVSYRILSPGEQDPEIIASSLQQQEIAIALYREMLHTYKATHIFFSRVNPSLTKMMNELSNELSDEGEELLLQEEINPAIAFMNETMAAKACGVSAHFYPTLPEDFGTEYSDKPRSNNRAVAEILASAVKNGIVTINEVKTSDDPDFIDKVYGKIIYQTVAQHAKQRNVFLTEREKYTTLHAEPFFAEGSVFRTGRITIHDDLSVSFAGDFSVKEREDFGATVAVVSYNLRHPERPQWTKKGLERLLLDIFGKDE